MESNGVPRDVHSYSIYMDILTKSGKPWKAIKIYKEMKRKDIKLDIVAYNIVLQSVGVCDGADASIQLYRDMLEAGLQPNIVTYNTIIKLLGEWGRIMDAYRLHEHFAKNTADGPDSGTLPSDASNSVDFNEKAIVKTISSYGNDWGRAFEFFNWAPPQCGFKHSVQSYNCMIDILGKAFEFNLAWDLIKRMQSDSGVSPDGVTFRIMFKRYIAAHLVQEAIDIYDRAGEFGLKDRTTFLYLVDALCEYKHVVEAQELCKKTMPNLFEDTKVHNMILRGWFKIGWWSKCREYWEEMESNGVPRDVHSYSIYMDILTKSGKPWKAVKIYKEMKRKVLQSVGLCDGADASIQLYRDMLEAGLQPNIVTYNTIIKLLGESGRIRDAYRNLSRPKEILHLFERMRESGPAPSMETYVMLIKKFGSNKLEGCSVAYLNKIENGFMPTWNVPISLKDVVSKDDTCKTKYQAEVQAQGHQKYRNLTDVLWEAISTRQVLSLYQGLGTKNLQSFISQFIYFYGYSYFKRLYLERSGSKSLGTTANLFVAAAAGACTAIVTQPLDTASSRMQTMFDQLKQRLLKNNQGNPSESAPVALSAFNAFELGAVSMSIATCITYPAIRCKVMIQASDSESEETKNPNPKAKKTITSALYTIWKREGLLGFFKGLQAQILKTVLSSALLLMIKEKITRSTWVLILALRRLHDHFAKNATDGLDSGTLPSDASNSVDFSEKAIVKTISSYGNDWGRAFEFFNWAPRQCRFKHSVQSYNCMIDILGKPFEFNLTWNLIKRKQSDSGVSPDGVTFCIMFKRYIVAHLVQVAIDTYDRASEFGLKDRTTFLYLVDALCEYKHVVEAQELCKKTMPNVFADTKVHNMILHGWFKIGWWSKCREYWEEMESNGVPRDVHSYSIYMDILMKSGKPWKAVKIYKEMKRKGIKLDIVAYNIVLQSVGLCDGADASIQLYRDMLEAGLQPNIVTYNTIIKLLGESGRIRDAYRSSSFIHINTTNVLPTTQMVYGSCFICHSSALDFCNSYGTGLSDWSLASTNGNLGLFLFATLAGNNGGVMSLVSTAADLI
ncbi:hypothetical protein H6P81_002446 [Aristolochia fimbriata]|uniref:Pentatricopeptide repeat-containing protein n=1 Tax=Aristolochia fimbriata TaxID=158543 RepID=A0AAV7FEC4_ARIFI|nr:hypothetical protein H6P81_002446 [Aristolochia fimbriata]